MQRNDNTDNDDTFIIGKYEFKYILFAKTYGNTEKQYKITCFGPFVFVDFLMAVKQTFFYEKVIKTILENTQHD